MSDLKDCKDDFLGVEKSLADNLNNEEQQNFSEEDCHYLKMLQYIVKNERSEGKEALDNIGMKALFLETFPAQREEIEKCINCIQEVADHIDKTHKDCTIATITASSAGATSGILTILGLALAPVTAGGSLILTATGVGLGAAAATTGISASVCEHFINSKNSQKAQELMNKCKEMLNKCRESLRTTMMLGEVYFNFGLPENKQPSMKDFQDFLSKTSLIPKLPSAVNEIVKNVKAFESLKANPALKALATKTTAAVGDTFKAALKGSGKTGEVFETTALTMSKGARVMGGTFAAAVLLFNVYCIVKDAIHLTKGAKATMAANIREKASNLKDILQKLNKLYQDLKDTGSN